MGVKKLSYYTVQCNKCLSVLEDYVGEVAGFTTRREKAEDYARESGFKQIGKNTWICPACQK